MRIVHQLCLLSLFVFYFLWNWNGQRTKVIMIRCFVEWIVESCDEPLGIESTRIKDYQITASSCLNDDFAKYGPQRARLNLASWPPGYRANPEELQSPWIKVNLETEKVITGLATQGYGDTSGSEWVTSYIVMYVSKMGETLQLTTMQGDPKVGVSLFHVVYILREKMSVRIRMKIVDSPPFQFCLQIDLNCHINQVPKSKELILNIEAAPKKEEM